MAADRELSQRRVGRDNQSQQSNRARNRRRHQRPSRDVVGVASDLVRFPRQAKVLVFGGPDARRILDGGFGPRILLSQPRTDNLGLEGAGNHLGVADARGRDAVRLTAPADGVDARVSDRSLLRRKALVVHAARFRASRAESTPSVPA